MPHGEEGSGDETVAVEVAEEPARSSRATAEGVDSEARTVSGNIEGDNHALNGDTAPSTTTAEEDSEHRDGRISVSISREPTPPPLPPRNLLDGRNFGSLRVPKRTSRPQLQSRPTTALSYTDIQTVNHQEGTLSRSTSRTISRKPSNAYVSRMTSQAASDAGETSSIKSYAPSIDYGAAAESLLGDFRADQATPAWKALSAQLEIDDPFDHAFDEDDFFSAKFHHEFDPLEDLQQDGSNEEHLLSDWKAKLKHFMILSSSGKPIWSRHGDDQLISSYVGIVQTIISFYQGAEDGLRGFTAGEARFVILSKGHLHLIATSRMGESDAQLRTQLESLYMQILSTLTLPSMERMFINRPSTDLRRPLQGTETLLDALADGFTRGSPTTLLSALECLRMRKTQRQVINNSLLKVRSPSLLYGLIVAGGRLVSVMRPKKHSLHPGDLQLIFNMLFEAGSVKAGGGENWIPLCLPGFNNTGYLYMYVSFVSASGSAGTASSKPSSPASPQHPQVPQTSDRPTSSAQDAHHHDDEVAFILISANKEAFFELRQMRDDLLSDLHSNKSMTIIGTAVRKGHPSVTDILPGTSLKHFIYKSRGNVQFTMPSFAPHFHGLVARRKLMNLYHTLHASIHTKTAHLKVQHVVSNEAISLAWETPLFELYCVAGPGASRQQLAMGANKVINWIRREEERVFIIGGAVF